MGVYIPNVDMPKDDKVVTIQICPDGSIWQQYRGTVPNAKAVPVPPHGDLIDRHEAYLRFGKLAETLEEKNDYLAGAPYAMAALFLNNVEEFPTIIPAEEGET